MNQPLQELTLDAANDTIESIPATAREMLEMDIAYVAQFTDGQQVFRHLDGDSRSFGVEPDQSMPLEGTYCQRMVEGDISNVVEDAPAIEALACLPVTETAAIGSYIGVPIHLSSGELYGTLCCLDHDTNHALAAREVRFMHVLGRLVAQALERKETDERLSRMRSQAQGLEALLAALGARDNYTGEHVQAVVGLAVGCARRIGLPEAKVGEIEQVALLHDIGKVGIADSILSKPGPLSDEEWVAMKEHPKIGSRIISSIDSLRHLAPAVRSEHERWDGKGYPDGLSGYEIPVASRIVFVCDAYHAMTSDRPYRKALSAEEARMEIADKAGSQFCPESAETLLTAL